MIKWMIKQINSLDGREEIEEAKDIEESTVLTYFFLIVFIIVMLMATLVRALGKVHFWSEFIQEFVAVCLWGTLMFFMSLGAAVGITVWKKTKNKVLSWVIALVLMLGSFGVMQIISNSIPGIGERFDKLLDRGSHDNYGD